MTVWALIAATVSLALQGRAARRRPLVALGLGALVWWLAGRWPPCAGSRAGATCSSGRRFSACSDWACHSGAGRVGPGLARAFFVLLPALILMPPLIRTSFDGLGLRLAALVMIPVVLFLGAMLPLLGPVVAARRRS